DVPHGSRNISGFCDRGGRTRHCHSRRGNHDRRRPHRTRRRNLLDAPLPRRRRPRSHPPSRHCFRNRNAHHGNPPPESQGRHRRHHHPVGRLPHGVQLLHHVRLFWWQRKVCQLLRDRRSAI